ncbi:DNA-binding response regulator, OmpR family, contains REC and winged-helix (wHTH) domain [Evansella caseinilytica]|uniref:DNA-binding response regulator, OmpR family, contains REC and winged-helix (WHTH) domain n=1 Tax=Evansella caseinilytica TaxID=1503961 RepID=A0A1H3UR08_9BACI|nr:response regulator transcription factor [Evansella caseinilytica]SDZ64471.1 DNA-binding response regulator, OmpR family, contains REC and winged-helix (wHTH) domain [Evansella caseinilytica]
MDTILVAEDEVAISQVLRAYMQKAGFHVVQAFDGNEVMKLFEASAPSLVLLDVMLPGKDGWSLLRDIRKASTCPVIMLTALDDIHYRLDGLNGGADDYITKPFIADEVVARVHAVLRRAEGINQTKDIIKYGQLAINTKGHRVTLGGNEILLTPRDLSLLLFLAQHPNQTFTRDQLIDRVWGMDYDGSDRAVDLAIKRIRKSLHDWSRNEGEIKTLRGLGYQFCVYKSE